jgi:hypothetical protein
MTLQEAMNKTIETLLTEYSYVQYESNRKVQISSCLTVDDYLAPTISLDAQVEHIKNRFELEETIDAVQVSFKVKLPRKRTYNTRYEYYRFL